ncbi:VWA domain-containing protein [Nonomuraea angiospora]|uniref:vWA domain-containing protein n=1 Tax=Nonomuraea angiospora TaxID=46172 RepID=UPI00340C35A8
MADVSGSMHAQGKIKVLNESVRSMIRSFAAEDNVRGEIWVAVVTFGSGGALLHQPLIPAVQTTWTDMRADGGTPMGQAFDLVERLLHDESAIPERAYTSTLVLVSDGKPTDEWQEPLERLVSSRRGAKSVRLAVGVGQEMDDEDFAVLTAFTGDAAKVVRAHEIDRLSSFFAWVTMSVTTQLRSGQPDTPPEMNADDVLGFMN